MDVELALHCMHNAARSEEEQGLEKSMRIEVKNTCSISSDAAGEEHVPELAACRISDDSLNIVLYECDGSSKEACDRPGYCNDSHGCRRKIEKRTEACHHEYACCYHRGSVDEGADWGRAFHRIRKPDMKRYLRRFACSAAEEQQGNQCRKIDIVP